MSLLAWWVFARRLVLSALTVVLSGCGSGYSIAHSSLPSAQNEALRSPRVLQTGSGAKFVAISLPTQPTGDLVLGHDHALYALGEDYQTVYRVTTRGSVKATYLGVQMAPAGLASGPGNSDAIWFAHFAHFGESDGIGYVLPDGSVHNFRSPAVEPQSMVAGTDGKMYVSGNTVGPTGTLGQIGVSNTDGTGQATYTFGSPSSAYANIRFHGLTAGPDNNIWFSAGADNNGPTAFYVMRFNPVSHALASFAVSGSISDVVAFNGALYYVQTMGNTQYFVRTTTNGSSSIVAVIPSLANVDSYQAPSEGPDGALWASATSANRTQNTLVRLSKTGVVSLYNTPAAWGTGSAEPGPDGNIWFVSSQNDLHIYVYTIHDLTVSPTSFAMTIGSRQPLSVSETTLAGSITVKSSNTQVVTVSGTAGMYTVTSVGGGACTLTVSDSKSNFVEIPVTVSL